MHAKLKQLSAAEKKALAAFQERLTKEFGNNIIELRLFGSRSRAEGDEQSDLDVAVIVQRESSRLRHNIYDIAAAIFLEKEVNISPLILSTAKFNWLKSIERRLALDIEKEGIKL